MHLEIYKSTRAWELLKLLAKWLLRQCKIPSCDCEKFPMRFPQSTGIWDLRKWNDHWDVIFGIAMFTVTTASLTLGKHLTKTSDHCKTCHHLAVSTVSPKAGPPEHFLSVLFSCHLITHSLIQPVASCALPFPCQHKYKLLKDRNWALYFFPALQYLQQSWTH